MSFGKKSKSFDFTALLGADILAAGDSELSLGDSVTMPASATAAVTVIDNDARLSGDFLFGDIARDFSGQRATIEIDGEVVYDNVKIFAEQYYQLEDEAGNLYILIEIERMGSASGDADDFYAFLGEAPPAASQLTVVGSGNVWSGVKYEDLTAGPIGVANQLSDDDETASVSEDSGVTSLANVLANAIDPEAGEPFVTAVGGDAVNVGAAVAGSDGGLFTIAADGTATFNANGDFDALGVGESAVTTIDYVVGDVDGGLAASVFTVTITGANDAPVAAADAFTTNEDTLLSGAVLPNDADVDGDALTAVLLSDVANGALTLNSDGTFDYTPNADFNGSDSFTYAAQDPSNAQSVETTVTITVNAVNDAPVAADDAFNVNEDTTLNATVIANDFDVDGDALIAQIVAPAANGAVTLNDDGAFAYTPNADFNGPDSFQYRLVDPAGATSDTATVTFTVVAVDDAPIGGPDAFTLAEDTSVSGNVLLNDIEVDGEAINAQLGLGPTNGAVTLNADGSFNYTPNADFFGADSFTYTAVDAAGTSSNPVTVSLTVTPVNDAPVAVTDNFIVEEGTVLTGNLFDNDIDVDGDTLTLVGGGGSNIVIDADGSFVYTAPSAPFVQTVGYVITDGNGEFDGAQAIFTVVAANDDPLAAMS